MEDNKPRYIVTLSDGNAFQLTEQEYKSREDAIFGKDKGATVARINDYSIDDDIDNNAAYTVTSGDNTFLLSADEYKSRRDKIRGMDGVHVGSLSRIDYWGDKLKAINDEINTLKPQRESALAAYNDPANSWDFTGEDMDISAATEAAKRSKAAKDELDDVSARLDKLYRDREANPAWQEQRNAKLKYFNDESAKIDGMFKELNAANEESAKISNSPLAGLSTRTGDADLAWDMRKNPNYYRDKAALTAAKMFYADAVKTESAPSRYDDSKTGFGNFFRGLVGEAPETLSAVALAKSLGENIPLAAAIKQVHEAEGNNANIVELVTKHPERLNYLSPAQKEMLTAFVVKSATDWARSEDISLGYQAGSTAMQSLGFMADFFLVGGLGEAAAKGATKGITKAIAKASVEAGLKGVQRELVQAVPKFLEGTIQAGVKTLVMSPFMPSSYANLLDNIYKINDAGQVDLSGRAIRNAIGDVLIENLSESAGTQVEAILGAPFRIAGKAGVGNIFANTKFGAWGKALKHSPMANIMKQAGWNGYIGEIGEEWYGNALRVMTQVDPDALKNFATVDQQIITHVSFAPMSLIGGVAAPSAQYLASKKQVAASAKILSDVLAKNGYDEQTIQNFLDVTKAENPTELANKLAPVINQAAKDNKDAPAVYKAVMDYAQAIARYRTFDGISEADVEEQRRGMLNEISAQTGFTPANEEEILTAPWIHQTEAGIADGETIRMQSVRVLTDADGKEMFVVGTPDAEGDVAVVDRDGGAHHFANVNDASLEDSGEMSINDYLDRELVRKKGTSEQERMTAERQQANAQLIQQAQPGMKVNLGTTENPDMAEIMGVDGGNYIVQKSDGTTAPFTPQEMAEKLGINTTPKTDAELEEEQAALLEKRDKNREFANRNYKGKTISWNGQQYTIVGVTRGRDSINTDGSVKEWAYDVQVTDANGQSMTIGMTDQEFDGVLESLFNEALNAAENGEPVATPAQEETPAAPVEDNTPRDFRGNALPMRTNKHTGQQVVDENALWNKDPEAWARWNDNNPNQRVTSKERLEDQIKDLDKQIEKDTKTVHNAALKGIDADKMDDMEYILAQKIERRNLLSSILDRYNMPAAAGPTIAGEQRKAAAEQTIAQQQAGFPGIQQKWNNAPKVVGAADEIRLANGETISGHYVLTDAAAPTPSHDPANGFAMTEGFPVDENGKTVNDRDYEHDKDAQQAVMEKAEHYDQRALQTPVIVSSDGVVLSGNDRTMAGQIAAYNDWDNAYVVYLAKYPQKYGFTAEQVGQFRNPRVVFVPDAAMPYNAATFAKFNAEDKKSQSKTEKAVKAGKTLTPETLGTLASLVDRYDDINALYNDADGVNELLDILIAAEVITPEQIAALKDGERLSGTGMDLLESTLIGAALDEEAVRIAMEDANIRKSVVSAIAQIIVGNTLAEYNLRAELTDAIQLVAGGKRAKEIKFGESVQSYIRQQHLFEEDVVAEATVQMLADAINDRKTSFLKKVLSLYNRDAVDSASGQLNLLTGDVLTREAILRNILEYLGYDTKIIFDTSKRAAEQQAAAEQPAGQAAETGPAQQNDAPVQSDAGSTVAQFNREEVAAILEQGNVGETGLAEIMTDDEIVEFMRLWDSFLPYNDALGEAYNRLSNDLRATAPKKTREAAQAEIDRLEQAQNEAFAPLQEYVDSLLEKYDLSTEQFADVAPVVEDAVADEVAEEMEDEFEDEVEDETEDEDEEPDPDEPKPTKGKKGSKRGKGKKAEAQQYVVKGGASEATIAKQTYTQEEYEQFIYGYSTFTTFVSSKTKEQVQIYMVDDSHPVYHDHRVIVSRRLPGPDGNMSKDGIYTGQHTETWTTTDYIIKYLKANKFKPTSKAGKKNKYGYWINQHGHCMNPIRIELPSVRKGWANFSEAHYYQDDSGKWFAAGSASYGTGGGTLGVKRGPYDTKSAAIRATIEGLEYFRKNHPGNHTDLRDVDNLIRTLKTKTLPQAMMEEGALNNVPRAEITASELDNGVQGLLFGEEGQTAAPAAAEEKPKQKRISKKKAETPAASVEETPVEDSEEEPEPKFVLEDEEGTPGNFHWANERVCTNPIIIAAPGLDKRSSVSKIALAEKDGKWYVASYVVEDSGKGTSWGTEIPSFKSNYIPYSSRYAAVKAGIDGIRWLLENMAPKYSNQFGNTWNNTKDLVDYLVRTELPATQKQDNRIETITEGLKSFDAAKGRAKFGKAFTNLMKSVGEMLGFEDDELNTALKDAAEQFKTEQVRFEDVDRAKARYVQRVRKALKETTGNNSMSGYGESSPLVQQEQESPAKVESPAAPVYGSQNTIITTEKYEELKRRMKEKLGQLNAGFDPETFFIGAQMAVYHVEAGARKFMDFSRRMISELGDAIRPYLKAIYNGARDLPGMEELRKEMDSAADVEAIDLDTIGLDFEDWKARVKEGDVYGDERVVSIDRDSAGGAGMITTEYLDTGGRSTTSMPNFYTQYFGEPAVIDETPVPAESTELPEVERHVWESRPETEIQGLEGMSSLSVYEDAENYINDVMDGVDGFNLVDMIVIGSRAFGTAREDSDLDILVEYDGDMKEDAVFNALNAEPLEILGIKVDFFPIRAQESGTLTEWLESHNNGRPVAKEQQEETPAEAPAVQQINVEGLLGAVSDMYAGKRSEVKLSDFAEPVQEETPSEESQPSETSGQQTVGELGKYTHTKTGKEMTIVRLTGDRVSSDEFKRLKARAKEFGGYYSSYGSAKGFLFDTEEDAFKFNNINTTTNVSENTDRKTASDTAVISSEAASVASKASSLAESAEPADERTVNRTIQRIDDTLDKIDDQLALLGYYEADQTGPFHESYGYMKSAEKKAVKDADRLAKKLAADLGIEVGRKTLAKANIAPAGGEVSFRLPLNDGHELYMCINLMPKGYQPGYGYEDDLVVRGALGGGSLAIYFRVENPNASGQARYVTPNNNQPYNVSYADLLKAIRRDARNYLPEASAATTATSGPVDVLQVAKEQAEKSRKSGKSAKKSVSSQEDGDAMLGGLFDTLYEAEDNEPEVDETPAPAERVKPTEVNGFSKGEKVIYIPDQGKRKGQEQEATIYDFEYDGRPVIDSGLAPVLYEVVNWEQIRKIENEPVNDTNDGLQRIDEQRAEGTPADGSGQQQGLQRGAGEESEVTGQESERTDRGGERGREGDVHGRSRTLRPRYDDSVKRNTRNYRRAKGDEVPKTVAARYKANIAAIRLLKELQDSGKQATKEQMAVLRQYTGWGGLGGYFNNEYSPEYREMRSLLTDEEMQAAALSIKTAYYTPTEIIDSMWDIAKRLGFEGGNVLEGSAGIGNILASMPKSISERSAITAVELDNITGGILQQLYPDANVQIKGFQEIDIPNGSVDLAITNVPFGDINVYDSKEKDLTRKFGGKIHDFCIAKNIRKLAEGGIGIFISTRGTLDGSSKALRQWVVNEGNADVIGAFRLNNATFEGTKATSDIIVVRKRVNGQVSPNAINVTDTEITRRVDYQTNETEWNKNTRSWEPITGKAAMELNSYFVEHPENMGGEMGFGFEHNDTYRPGSSALWPTDKIDQNKRLAKWAKQFSSMQEEVAPTVSESESVAEDTSATKEGQLITNSKGEICISRSGKAVPIAVNAQKVKGYSKAQVLADYDALKTAINEVLDYQLNNESDEGLKPLLDKLNKAYDRFAKRYDRLNRNTAISFLRNDVDFPSIAAVEDYREKKGIDGKVKIEVKKTSIFSGRVLGAKRIPTPSNAKDGVIVSINQFGRIDIPFIAEALNKDEETVRKEILASGLGFENPLTGNVDVEYEYLSGNVREKLEYARAHNTEGQYDKNIEALEKVIPADIPAHLIEFSLGSDWMPVELYTGYAKEKFGVNDNFVPTMVGGSWILPENTWEMGVNTEKNRAAGVHSEKLRTDKMGHELMIAAMNNTSVVFSRSYKDPATGETITEHDKEATQAATTKMSEMRDDFKEWCKAKMLDTPELAERIAKIYNDTFNAIVPKEIRDTFIPEHFDGMATKLNNGKPLNLRQHQAKAVIRATTEPLMMAHEVGTGKTFTLIATAMEMRRLGTAKKPMIVVQNATLGQFVSSAKELYPNAKILTISEADRTVEGRSAFYAKIKYNDWDMIVVPQSVFEMIPDSEERQRAFIQEKIDEKKFILEQAKQAKNSTAERQLKKELEDLEYEYQYGEKPPKKGKGGKKDAKKEAEAVENAVAKAKKQLDRRTDDVSDFDDMGIDALLIDEAHSYKHLGFSTAMQRGVKGVDATGSKKSAGVYLKTRAVFDKVGWKNVVFATGTPISNTAAEIWTFMKYLMPADVMRQHHIYYFDDFVRNFGNISQSLEFTTSGKFKETTRFASYTNLPELIRIWSSVTDTVRSKDAVAEGDEKLEDKQPKMEGGQARDIYLPQSLSLVDIMNAVRAKLEWYEGLSGKEKKENSHIPLTMFGIAKMAAIDPRLVDRNAQDEPNSKTNKAVEETLRALKDSERYKGTAALFCDNFRRWDYNDAGKRVEGFNIFEEIKRKLVAAGVPEGQIVIMKSGMTTAAKEKIFARVNSGEVRVIMGTTATLGTGVNIQERLFFEAHLDAPNRPMDYTQRNGRILRQGNLHKEWGIPVRVVRFGVEDSLDVTAYQRLSTKAKFIDSIMDGKPLLANGMENRVLEEEDEGEFDNPVAVLSGSQYALLKSQAERELRKLRNKKEQHRQDQIYIERTLKENKNRIAYDEKRINEANANLAKVKANFPDGTVKEVTIEGRKAKGAEQIAEAIKDKITTPLRSRLDSRRVERGFTNETLNYTMTFDGVPVNIKVDVERMNEYDDKRHEYRPFMRTRVEYSVPRFGIEGRFVLGGYTSIKDIVPDFMGKIATGRYFEDAVNNLTNTVNRLNSDNELMLQRRGKPFADEDKLTEQEKIVADYTEKMKAELAEKEAKYAELAKNATTSFKLDDVSVEDEDEDSEGETSAEYSDMDGNGFFSGIEDRKEDEDAKTFTDRVVTAVTTKYPFLKGKVVTVTLSDQSPERLAKLPNGRYIYKHKKIAIFAREDRTSADGVEKTILHEAIHMLIHDFGWHKDRHFINLFNTMLYMSDYYSLDEYREVFADVKATYEEKNDRKYTDAEIREEMVTFELSHFLQTGLAKVFIDGTKEYMPELGEQLEKLVNTLGYEPTSEFESRMDEEILKEYRENRIQAAQQRNAERRSVGDSGHESVSGNGATAGERSGEGDVQEAGSDGSPLDEGGASYELVTDPETIQRLERGEKGTGYRNVVQNADGSLGSPMAGKLGRRGERSRATSPFFLNQWEQAEENPDLATEDGKINLIKPQGRGNVDGVDYNPYIHIRPTTLNRQFTQAWRRPELVYVETAYPASELESGYKADKAKLSVGRHPWNGGELILSRYDKPTRVVPWAEVAEEWVKEYQGTGVTFDIVPPELLPELASRGVEILPPKKAAGKPAMDAYNKWRSGVRNRVGYHGSIADFDAFDINHAGEGEGFQSHGFGHYIALDRNTGVGYAWSNAFDKADREGKIEPEIAEILRNDSFDDYDSMVERYDELLAKRKEDVAKELAAEKAERTPDMAVVRTLQTEQENLQRYGSLRKIFEGTRNVYTVEIPDDTGENYIDEMKTLSKSGRRRIAEVVRNQDASLLQTAKFGPNWLPNGLETLANVIEREQLAGIDLRRRLSAAFGSEKEASRIMHEAGFVGIKYDGRSDGPCVVIFSNDDIHIVNHERFRFMGEIGAKALDDAEEASIRLDNLAVAREMEKAGKTAGKIKQLTGWERGADGLWRYEVPDNVTINEKTFDEIRENLDYNSKTDFDANRKRMDEDAAAVARWDKLWEDYRSNEGEIDKMRREYELVPRKTEYKLSEIINAPELFDAYPQFKNMSVAILESMPGAWGRSWGGAIDLHAAFFMGEGRKYGHKSLLGVLVHELQHEIQRVEGFETGASGRDRDYDERAGEVEARNVTTRREMGVSARLRTLAEETEDVARKDQTFIHRAINDVADSRIGEESTPSPASYTESMGARRLSASETARKCGIEIEFRPSSQMQFNGKPIAGRWINGKMYICLEHCRDAADAVRTVLHEGVGHNGLRRLIGDENMTAFCLDMFRRLPIDARTAIADAAITKYGGDIAEATEEYLAERAEVMDFDNEDYERNFWDIVLDGLRRVLAKVGIDIPLSQRDVRWLMWQSYNANKQTDVLNEAKRQVVANKLGFTLRQLSDEGQAVQIARNKIAEEELAPAARIYNKDVVYWFNRLHETWVDKDNAVHSLVEAIEKATGKAAAAFEDIRLALNQQSSKGLAAIEKWERENWMPMQAAIKALMGVKGCDLHAIERYVMIKHGLERNEVFAKRDAKAFYQDLRDSAVAAIDKALEKGTIDQNIHDMMVAKEDAKLDKHVKAVDAGTDVKYKELRKQDYGGLTAMYSEWDAYEPFMEGVESEEEYKARVLQARHPKYTYIDENGREKVDMAATEEAAMNEVEEFEKGSEKAVEELWKRINNATKATLKHQYDANMMSRQQYLSVSGMFKYYVPLRGFADNTAEDMYDYYTADHRNDFEPPLLKAKGRKTEAESPFGYIGSMASSGIAADMKNETKLSLYYFVSNRAANDLVTISEVWYKNTGMTEDGKRIFTPVYPPFKEDLSSADAKQAYEDWEKQMQEEAKAGFAFKGSHKLNLHNSVIHIDKGQAASHVIKFKVGGRDMMMFINGNPRAAQAINNELNVEMSTDYQKVFGKVLRWFSGINTSYNPEFWLSNAQRDALFALMSVDVKEDNEYGKAFRKNFGRLLRDTLTPGKKGGAYSLKRKLDKGELGDERLDKLYKEFVENGGVTGYTTLKNNEEWELELRKYTGQEKQAVAAVKNAFEAVQHFGEAIEQMTRFAAYITSREQGKEIKDAVNDAKELTVNFNRKGSGQAISFKEAARLRTKKGHPLNPVQKAFVVGASWLPVYGRRFIMFFNASTQGLNAMYKLFKKDKGRMGTWAAAYLALGVIQAVIHGMLDDDDDYLDIPDYERRNNLLLGGKGVYFKWALPQECRVFYGIGDMAVNHIMGRTPHRSILSEILASASDIAPLNPAGGISAIAPSALTPVFEVYLNRDYKGSKIYNDMRYLSDEEKKRTPKYTMAYQGTGKPYILLSQFANWLSGGDYADAGWFNINPASVEHILQGATGGAGTTIGKFYKGTVGQVLGEDFTVRNTPFLSRILTVTDDRYRNAHTTELFDYYKAEAEHVKKLVNTYSKNGDDKKLDKLFDSEDYEIMQIYESYKGMMKYYNDELKYTTDKKERKALMREQDALRKEMIQEISDIGSK